MNQSIIDVPVVAADYDFFNFLSLIGYNLHFGPSAIRTKFSPLFSRVWLFATPGTIAHQAPLSMGFSRQEYWSGLPFPTPGDFPDPGIKPKSPVSPALAGRFFTTAPPAMSPKSPAYNIKDLMIVHIVHRLASGFVHFKPVSPPLQILQLGPSVLRCQVKKHGRP